MTPLASRAFCKLFGHAPLTRAGWKGGVGYADVSGFSRDGMGRGHLYLRAKCPRCGERYAICGVHAEPGRTSAGKSGCHDPQPPDSARQDRAATDPGRTSGASDGARGASVVTGQSAR